MYVCESNMAVGLGARDVGAHVFRLPFPLPFSDPLRSAQKFCQATLLGQCWGTQTCSLASDVLPHAVGIPEPTAGNASACSFRVSCAGLRDDVAPNTVADSNSGSQRDARVQVAIAVTVAAAEVVVTVGASIVVACTHCTSQFRMGWRMPAEIWESFMEVKKPV